MPMAPWLEDFLHQGFWAMGIVSVFLVLSLIGNSIESLLIILKRTIGDSLGKIALGALVMAAFGTTWVLIHEWRGEPFEVSVVLILMFWSWYFIFVPQFLIFLMIERKRAGRDGMRQARIGWRIALTVLLPVVLSFVHWAIGIYVLHITPD